MICSHTPANQEKIVGTQSVVLSAKRAPYVFKPKSSVSQVHAVLPMSALVRKICLELGIYACKPKVRWRIKQLLGCVEWVLPNFASLQVQFAYFFFTMFLILNSLNISLQFSYNCVFLFQGTSVTFDWTSGHNMQEVDIGFLRLRYFLSQHHF